MNSICLYIESCCKDDKTLIVIGDLNCGNIDWANHTVKGDESQVHFYNTVIGLGFTQFIDLPTRGDNILDVLLCNDPQLISNISIDEPFSTSDHATVNFIVNIMISDGRAVEVDFYDNFTLDNMHDLNDNYYCGSTAQYISSEVYNWSKADWASLGFSFI